jgi:predicted transcriptional regulator
MPDLRTEMSKVLNAWEQDEQQTQENQTVKTRPKTTGVSGKVLFGVTNNVSRETFNFVKNNPAQSYTTIVEAMSTRGFKKTSVASLLTQFVKQGMISRDEDGTHYAEVEEYSPLKSTKKLKTEGKRKNKIVKAPRSQGIAALNVAPKPVKEKDAGVISSVITTTQWDAETVINNIGLKQAHALYKELSTYFGG